MWLSYPTLRSFRLLFKSKQCLRDSLINLTLFVRVALIDWKLWYSVNMYHPKELAHYKSFCKYLLHLVSSRVWLYGNYSITKIIIAKKFSTLGKYVVYFHIMSVDLVAWFLNSASCNTFSCINSIVLYDMINDRILDHTWSIQYVIKSSFQYFCYLRWYAESSHH